MSSELDYVRTYGEQVTIERQTASRDANFAIVNTWTAYKTIQAWKQPIGSDLRDTYERRGLNVDSKWFMATDPEVREGDRIRIASGKTYVVRGIIDQAGLGRVWRLDTQEQDGHINIAVFSSSSSSSPSSSSSFSIVSSSSSSSSISSLSSASSSSISSSSISSASSESSSSSLGLSSSSSSQSSASSASSSSSLGLSSSSSSSSLGLSSSSSSDESSSSSSGAAAWLPSDLTALEAWYDASDSGTITESSGSVSQWNDKSASGFNLTQGTGASQPTTGTKTLNSLNVLNFASDFMTVNTGTNHTGNTLSVVAVVRRNSSNNLSGLVVVIDDATAADYSAGSAIVGYQSDASTMKAYNSGGALSSITIPGNDIAYIYGSIFDGTNQTCYDDGTAGTPVATSLSFNWDELIVGCRWEGSAYQTPTDSDYAEIVVVDGALSTDDRQKTEGYLAHKWGLTANLPGGHPYKTVAP